MEYEIRIGEVRDFCTGEKRPAQTLIITEEQKQVIEQFANTKKDADLNTVYILNDFEFQIFPKLFNS